MQAKPEVRMFGQTATTDAPKTRSAIKTLRREDEVSFPNIPEEYKNMVWTWLRTWKLTSRKLNWSDYSLGRLLDNLEESFSDSYYTDNGSRRAKECSELYGDAKILAPTQEIPKVE